MPDQQKTKDKDKDKNSVKGKDKEHLEIIRWDMRGRRRNIPNGCPAQHQPQTLLTMQGTIYFSTLSCTNNFAAKTDLDVSILQLDFFVFLAASDTAYNAKNNLFLILFSPNITIFTTTRSMYTYSSLFVQAFPP